jgi:hypothetical protein
MGIIHHIQPYFQNFALAARIHVYAHIRIVVVLTCGNANWVTFHVYFL